MDSFWISECFPRQPQPAADSAPADVSQPTFAREFETLVRQGHIALEHLPSGMVYYRLLRFDWPNAEQRGEGTEGVR